MRTVFASHRAIALALALGGMAPIGCYGFGPTGSSSDAPAPIVGPSPLRRLSNSEYLNALRDLFPAQSPTLPELPMDTASSGFENAAEAQQPSDVRISRYETIANLYAAGATTDAASVRVLVGCDYATSELAAACASSFIDTMGSRLFRRPLENEEHDRFATRFQAWQTSIDFEGAVRLTLSAFLQSPQFLYRAEPSPVLAAGATSPSVAVEPYAMASRLSFFLWESVPDDALLAAASRDELHTEDQIRAQADRLLQDDRARRVLWNFHRQWLGLDRILTDEHMVRTPDIDPAWSPATQLSAHTESEMFVENLLMGNGTLRDLLTSRRAWVDAEMARIYGVSHDGDPAAFTETTLPADQRAGLLTRVAFLAGYSHRGGTSPPVRGNGVELRFLCELPISPPPGVNLSMPTADPSQGPQTNRMLFAARTAPASCQGCHKALNGFGFGLENYNAAGAFHTQENGLAIDASGVILGTDVDRPFTGGIDLSTAFQDSTVVHHCATQQWIRYALGRAPTSDEAPVVDALTTRFQKSGGNVRGLLMDIVTAPTFRMRRVGGT